MTGIELHVPLIALLVLLGALAFAIRESLRPEPLHQVGVRNYTLTPARLRPLSERFPRLKLWVTVVCAGTGEILYDGLYECWWDGKRTRGGHGYWIVNDFWWGEGPVHVLYSDAEP